MGDRPTAAAAATAAAVLFVAAAPRLPLAVAV